MTSTTSRDGEKGEILKVDVRGRVQVSEERREALLDEFDRSGMSGAGFAKHAGESVETMTQKVVQISTCYGDDGVTAVRKVGPRAFDVIADAGDHSAGVVKLMARHGDEAVWVVSKPKGMAIFVKYGDEGAEALMKHKGIATPFVEKTGESGVKALNAVGPSQGRRLVDLVDDGVIVPGRQSAGLLDVEPPPTPGLRREGSRGDEKGNS